MDTIITIITEMHHNKKISTKKLSNSLNIQIVSFITSTQDYSSM